MGFQDNPEFYEFHGIDQELFRDMQKSVRNKAREEKKQMVLNGEKDSPDINFHILKTDDEVLVNHSSKTPIITGRVRMAHTNDAYVVENKDGVVLTLDMIRPGLQIGSSRPYIFDIMKPNHHMVFLNMKELEMAQIEFIFSYSERSRIPIAELVGNIHKMIEKYPEKFV